MNTCIKEDELSKAESDTTQNESCQSNNNMLSNGNSSTEKKLSRNIIGKTVPPNEIDFDAKVDENEWARLDKLDADLMADSEKDYREIARDIVDTSIEQLNSQNEAKHNLKEKFTTFFTKFIVTQYIVLVLLIVARMIFGSSNLSDQVLVVYIASVFVETLGAIVLMIKYAFDSQQETNVLKILNSVIRNYQKFKGDSNNEKKAEKASKNK